jgi:hypothetical protein
MTVNLQNVHRKNFRDLKLKDSLRDYLSPEDLTNLEKLEKKMKKVAPVRIGVSYTNRENI